MEPNRVQGTLSLPAQVTAFPNRAQHARSLLSRNAQAGARHRAKRTGAVPEPQGPTCALSRPTRPRLQGVSRGNSDDSRMPVLF